MEVQKELVATEQPKNWHSDPAQTQATLIAFWQQSQSSEARFPPAA